MKKYLFSLLLVLTCSLYSMEDEENLTKKPEMSDVDSDSDTEMAEVKERTEGIANILGQFLAHVRSSIPKTPEDLEKAKESFMAGLQNKMLLSSCFLDNTAEVKALLENGADVNFQSSNKEDIEYEGYTCLMHAAKNKNIELIKLLLKYKPNLELKDKLYGGTALFKSLIYPAVPYPKEEQENCIRVAKILLMAGADINAKDKDFESPLIKHARMGNLEIVKFLVFNGASLELENQYGESAIDGAIDNNHIEVEQFLENYPKIQKITQKIVNKAKHEIRTKEILRNTVLNKDVVEIISDYCDEIE